MLVAPTGHHDLSVFPCSRNMMCDILFSIFRKLVVRTQCVLSWTILFVDQMHPLFMDMWSRSSGWDICLHERVYMVLVLVVILLYSSLSICLEKWVIWQLCYLILHFSCWYPIMKALSHGSTKNTMPQSRATNIVYIISSSFFHFILVVRGMEPYVEREEVNGIVPIFLVVNLTYCQTSMDNYGEQVGYNHRQNHSGREGLQDWRYGRIPLCRWMDCNLTYFLNFWRDK